MSALGLHQERFVSMLTLLYARADLLAIKLRLGCGWCQDNHHMAHSLHKDRLAQDFDIVDEDDTLGTWEDYEPLGLYWERIGGTWGGRFGAGADGRGNDPRHFSLAYGGRK